MTVPFSTEMTTISRPSKSRSISTDISRMRRAICFSLMSTRSTSLRQRVGTGWERTDGTGGELFMSWPRGRFGASWADSRRRWGLVQLEEVFHFGGEPFGLLFVPDGTGRGDVAPGAGNNVNVVINILAAGHADFGGDAGNIGGREVFDTAYQKPAGGDGQTGRIRGDAAGFEKEVDEDEKNDQIGKTKHDGKEDRGLSSCGHEPGCGGKYRQNQRDHQSHARIEQGRENKFLSALRSLADLDAGLRRKMIRLRWRLVREGRVGDGRCGSGGAISHAENRHFKLGEIIHAGNPGAGFQPPENPVVRIGIIRLPAIGGNLKKDGNTGAARVIGQQFLDHGFFVFPENHLLGRRIFARAGRDAVYAAEFEVKSIFGPDLDGSLYRAIQLPTQDAGQG